METMTKDSPIQYDVENGKELVRREEGAVTAFQPRTMNELLLFCETISRSELVPREMRGKTADIIVAVQMGSELGLKPMTAIQNICVINGKPSVYGDAMLGLVKDAKVLQDFDEQWLSDEDGNVYGALCMAHRRGEKPVVRQFTIDDAKKADLWTKPGPWKQYPNRMLQMRARSWALRDTCPDVLKGLVTREEALDMDDDVSGPTDVTGVVQQAKDKAQAVRERLAARTSAASEVAPAQTGKCTCHAPVGKPHDRKCPMRTAQVAAAVGIAKPAESSVPPGNGKKEAALALAHAARGKGYDPSVPSQWSKLMDACRQVGMPERFPMLGPVMNFDTSDFLDLLVFVEQLPEPGAEEPAEGLFYEE